MFFSWQHCQLPAITCPGFLFHVFFMFFRGEICVVKPTHPLNLHSGFVMGVFPLKHHQQRNVKKTCMHFSAYNIHLKNMHSTLQKNSVPFGSQLHKDSTWILSIDVEDPIPWALGMVEGHKDGWSTVPWRIHGTAVDLRIHAWFIFMVGNFTRPMDPMGVVFSAFVVVLLWSQKSKV